MTKLTLKTFTDSGCFAHLIGCTKTGRAILVDPKHGKHAIYVRAAEEFGLEIVAVLDTHTHADHLSDSAAFGAQKVELWMSEKTGCARPHRALKDGEKVSVGELEFRALALPGHTPDSIALYGNGIVVTGDSLLAGGLARADFRGSNPAQLFDSVATKLLALPDETVVLPGHGYRDILFSTIGHEKKHNPDLQFANGAAFARHLDVVEGAGNSPEVDLMLATNLEAKPKLAATSSPVAACCAVGSTTDLRPRPKEITPEEAAPKREGFTANSSWIDVRDPHEFRETHIPGALNFPLSELGLHLEELKRTAAVVFSCRSGARSMTAAKTLQYLGVVQEPINLSGGILRWAELGLPVESSKSQTKTVAEPAASGTAKPKSR